LFEKGSAGRAYLLKERVSDLEQLVGAIREVASGGSVIDPEVVDALVSERMRGDESPIAELTPREREVLGEMAQGKNNAAIAESLVLTERAVEKHINSIFSKLNFSFEKDVHRRVKAVLLYLSDQAG
jgi:DNA-binding NarL/FixJ family response regulator